MRQIGLQLADDNNDGPHQQQHRSKRNQLNPKHNETGGNNEPQTLALAAFSCKNKTMQSSKSSAQKWASLKRSGGHSKRSQQDGLNDEASSLERWLAGDSPNANTANCQRAAQESRQRPTSERQTTMDRLPDRLVPQKLEKLVAARNEHQKDTSKSSKFEAGSLEFESSHFGAPSANAKGAKMCTKSREAEASHHPRLSSRAQTATSHTEAAWTSKWAHWSRPSRPEVRRAPQSRGLPASWATLAWGVLVAAVLLLVHEHNPASAANANLLQYFEVQPEAQYLAQAGHEVRMRCLVRNRQGECVWLRNGLVMLHMTRKYIFNKAPEDGDCSLLIKNASASADDGRWQCQVTPPDTENHEHLQSRDVHLIVLVPPEKPQIKNLVSTKLQAKWAPFFPLFFP